MSLNIPINREGCVQETQERTNDEKRFLFLFSPSDPLRLHLVFSQVLSLISSSAGPIFPVSIGFLAEQGPRAFLVYPAPVRQVKRTLTNALKYSILEFIFSWRLPVFFEVRISVSRRDRALVEVFALNQNPEENQEKRRMWSRPSLALLGYIAAALLMLGPHVFPLDYISESTYSQEDAYICLWGLWWTKNAVLHGLNPYWTDFLFYPMGTSLVFHAYPLTYGLLSLPFQLLMEGVSGLVAALNSIIFLSFVLSGFGAYLLASHVTGSRLSSWVAGVIYAFIPFHSLNRVTLHLLAIECIPFTILSLLRLSEKPTVGRAILVGLCFALTYYSSLEYALYLFMFSGIWIVYKLLFTFRDITRKHIIAMAGSCVIFLLLVSPLVLQQMKAYLRYDTAIQQDFEEVTFWSPALLSFITPSRVHPWYGQALASAGELTDARPQKWGMRSETSIAWVALLLAAVGLMGHRNGQRIFWSLLALFFFLLCLGPFLRVTGEWFSQIPLPYLLIYNWVPVFRTGRDPTRFILLAMMMLSILSAFGVDSLLRHFKTARSRFLLAMLFSSMILFESLTAWIGSYRPSLPPVYRQLAGAKRDVAIIDLTPEPYKLLPQTLHHKKITYLEKTLPRTPSKSWMLPVEYDFRFPTSFSSLDAQRQSERLKEHRESLDALRIRFILLPRGPQTLLQINLAERLGAIVQEAGELFICRFP